MSHIVRCEVLEAIEEHRFEWLAETIDYMAGRYPDLTDLELAHLETMGRQYLRPAIDHGSGNNAVAGRRDATPDEVAADTAPAEVSAGTPADPEMVAA